jgi:hypothetical protein
MQLNFVDKDQRLTTTLTTTFQAEVVKQFTDSDGTGVEPVPLASEQQLLPSTSIAIPNQFLSRK